MRLPKLDPRRPFDPARFPLFYGWVIVACATLGMIASIPGQTMGVSVFTDIFIEEMGLSRLQLAGSYLIGTVLSGFLLPYGGRLFDRVGARWFCLLAFVVFGFVLFFLASVDWVYGAASLLLGGSVLLSGIVMTFGFFSLRFLGQGLVTLGSRSMQAKWWNRRRGFVGGIGAVAIGFIFSLAPLYLDWQIQLFGWRGTYIVNGLLLIVVMGSLAYLFFRDNPEECGLEMDGGFIAAPVKVNPDLVWKKDFTLSEAYRTYAFWIVSLMLAMNALVGTAYTFHVVDIGRSYGVDRRTILGFFAFAAAVSVPTNLLLGLLADHIRIRYLVAFIGIAGAILGLGILHLPSLLGVVLLVVGLGTSGGGFSVVMNVAYPRYYGRAHIGAINGASMLFFVWGSALGPLFYSLGLSWAGSYDQAVIAGSVVYLILAVAALWASNPQRDL